MNFPSLSLDLLFWVPYIDLQIHLSISPEISMTCLETMLEKINCEEKETIITRHEFQILKKMPKNLLKSQGFVLNEKPHEGNKRLNDLDQ